MADITMERILEWRILPRLMMVVMTLMYIRVIEWGISLDDLSTQQSAMISVVSGAMTGTIAVWLGSERK
jgi:Tfp pilus assembly protein PilO